MIEIYKYITLKDLAYSMKLQPGTGLNNPDLIRKLISIGLGVDTPTGIFEEISDSRTDQRYEEWFDNYPGLCPSCGSGQFIRGTPCSYCDFS